ncbi:MAG: DUF922 domain-containing protein [Alphaproteobacteria bacterium]|nr:MAG: DUF922 domain-containing protein [Alphaproteobacteria bacterium]
MKVAETIPKPAMKTFTVKGKTIVEVFNALEKHKWWGRYRSNESARWTGSGKMMNRISVTAKPVIYLPVWANYKSVNKPSQKSWDKMLKALKKHEEHHHTIFTEEVAAWKKEMEADGDQSKSDVEAAWKAFKKNTQKAQDDYDKRTNHGEKEGVVLEQP